MSTDLLRRLLVAPLPYVPRPVVWQLSRRYIAGMDLESAFDTASALNELGCLVTIDVLGEEVHGNGANIDNFETHDERPVIPWTCFSIEPALYLPDFGVRTEINLFVADRDARVTGERQTDFVKL